MEENKLSEERYTRVLLIISEATSVFYHTEAFLHYEYEIPKMEVLFSKLYEKGEKLVEKFKSDNRL